MPASGTDHATGVRWLPLRVRAPPVVHGRYGLPVRGRTRTPAHCRSRVVRGHPDDGTVRAPGRCDNGQMFRPMSTARDSTVNSGQACRRAAEYDLSFAVLSY